MATTKSKEKRPAEIIPLVEDFSDVLGGALLDDDNISVVITDFVTGADVTASLLVPDSDIVVDDVKVICQLKNGVAGKLYLVSISTGATSSGELHVREWLLKVTNSPTSATLLCDLPALKLRLKITDTSEDPVLTQLLTISSEYFRRRVGRELTLDTRVHVLYYEEDQPITSRTRLQLNEWPVQSVSSVVLRTDPTDPAPDTIPADDIAFDKEGFVWLRNGSVFLPFPNENVVTYLAGYAPIPPDIAGAVAATAAFFFRLLTYEGLSSERLGEYSYTRRSLADFPSSRRYEVPDEAVEGIIRRYRRQDLDF